jgi:MFS transporter, MHS family, proline/betaine transporter
MSQSYVLAVPASVSYRTIAASIIGNILEWFDFAVYGFFAAVIGRLFFPATEPSLSLIAAFGVFAVGFLMRPLGGAVFGYIGDRHGRSLALFLSIGTMAVGTLFLGLLPTYETAGILAPILMIFCRILQGLAVGGEYACSIVVLVETAPAHLRGFRGSLAPFGATAGSMLGSAAGALLFYALSEQEVAEWGWRLPFISGVVVAFAGIYLRWNFVPNHESPPKDGLPFISALMRQKKEILIVIGLNLAAAVGFYMIFIYLPQYMQGVAHIGPSDAFHINTFNMAITLLVMPLSAYLSDRIGRKPVMYLALALMIVVTWPMFTLLHSLDKIDLLLAQLGLTLALGIYLGVVPVILVEQFSAAIRCTAAATSFNLVVGVFGGTTPMLCVYLISQTGNDMTPALYLIFAAAVALLTGLSTRETAFRPLKI